MAEISFRKLLAAAIENWFAKVLAVILAIFLFVFHQLSTLESRFFSAPLQVEANDALAPATALPGMVRVTLRGEANSIYPIQESDIVVYIDLKRYSAGGAYRVPVQIRKKGTALGVEPLETSVDPVEIVLELDTKTNRTVPVNPDFTGTLEPGYEMVSWTLSPAQAVVEGPERLIRNLRELRTEPIDQDGRNGDFQGEYRITLDDPRMAIRGALAGEFHGTVKRLVIIRGFENLPITVRGLAENLAAFPEIRAGSIRVQGNQDEIENYVPLGTALRIDCSQITAPGTYTLPVIADIPPAFTLVRREPAAVTVEVREK